MRKLALLALWPGLASAGDLDLDLSRFATVRRQGDVFTFKDANGQMQTVNVSCGRAPGDFCFAVPDNQAWYSLASELGVVLAPKFLMPAETMGYNGFSIGFQTGFTKISNDADFWHAAEEYDPNDPGSGPPQFLTTIGAMVHKGIWLPLPSFELGAGFNYLPKSDMWMMLVDTKFAIHEGFANLPLPEIAVRGTGGRMVGNSQMDLTLAGLDFSMSKSFGVFGTFNLTPYAGYQILWIIADPEILDATPGEDAIAASPRGKNGTVPECSDNVADCNAYFVFFNPDPILRHRMFVGVRLIVGVFNLTAEFAMAVKGSTSFDYQPQKPEDGRLDTDPRHIATAKDQAGLQPAANVMVGLDF
jgi:hypothetical protein